jgi:hypothetical protein
MIPFQSINQFSFNARLEGASPSVPAFFILSKLGGELLLIVGKY